MFIGHIPYILRGWYSSICPNRNIIIESPLAAKAGQKNDLSITQFYKFLYTWKCIFLVNPLCILSVFPCKKWLKYKKCFQRIVNMLYQRNHTSAIFYIKKPFCFWISPVLGTNPGSFLYFVYFLTLTS